MLPAKSQAFSLVLPAKAFSATHEKFATFFSATREKSGEIGCDGQATGKIFSATRENL